MDFTCAIIALGFLVLSLVFSTLHAALQEVVRGKLIELVQRRGHPVVQARLDRILADIPAHGRAMALARMVVNMGVVVSVVWCVASTGTPPNPDLPHALIGGGIAAILLWIFSVAIPHSIASYAAEPAVYSMCGVIRVVYATQSPLIPVGKFFDEAVRRITGARQKDDKQQLEEELLSVIDEGERDGQLDEADREMMESVVEFRSRTVEQIMTPRTEIEALELTANLGQITAFVRKARHSRIPVYKAGGGLDDIVGFFYVKDLLRWLAGEGAHTGRGFDLRAILRPAMFVPESKTIRELLGEFVTKKVHIAMVADEYGGTSGLVSLEDIIEEVFGEIQDEYEKAEDEPPRIEVKPEKGLAEIDARADIQDVNEALEPLGVALPEDDGYDTLGGFVMAQLGHIPETNESFTFRKLLVTVLEATPMRVLKVRVQVKAEEPDALPAGAGRDLNDRGK